MTLLTHYHDRSVEPVRRKHSTGHARVPTGASRETAMRRFFRGAVTIMLGTAAVAGVIAVKTAIYLPHFSR
jgi:ABC-type phosphate transport system permease subunit